MNHFTHEKSSASEECLHFIRAFARFYLPEKDNEEEARQMARRFAEDAVAWIDSFYFAAQGLRGEVCIEVV